MIIKYNVAKYVFSYETNMILMVNRQRPILVVHKDRHMQETKRLRTFQLV